MERDIEILEYRIAECNRLEANYIFYGLSQTKINKLIAKRDGYQAQLDELQA